MVKRRGLWASSVVMVVLAGCGSSSDEAESSTSTTLAPATTVAADTDDTSIRPVVSIPAALPTELEITEIVPGAGRAAELGDAVVVDYVGARSATGEVFDNSWDRGQPFMAVLGTRSVIAGWEQGLVGAREGARLQLDIPSELAYGDDSPGGIIEPGDALSFVVDIRAVVPPSNPDDAPVVDVPLSNGSTELSLDDLVIGEGRAIEEGSQVLAQLLVYRGDTGELLDSTWDGAGPVRLIVAEGELVPGMYQSLLGVRQGGRRLAVLPFSLAFGAAGNTDLGLPPATDVVLVLDVLAVF
jgi:FKBP-type peptidyl-prolyl cis-trans isomerase